MPKRSVSHIPRIILENADKFQAAKQRPVRTFKIWKLVTGDMVQVMEGKSAGERGKITAVDRKKNTILVDQINLVKKHIRSTPEQKGGIFTQSAPIHYSNVALIDPVDGEPTKVRWEKRDGMKVRVSKRTGEVIPKPEAWKKPYPTTGPRDTSVEDTIAVTYETPFYVSEIFKLERELREMRYLRKEESSSENSSKQEGENVQQKE